MPGSFLGAARPATPAETARVLAAARSVAQLPGGALQAPAAVEAATKISPGSERWPVKTGTDDDVGQVDATKIVSSTVRELGLLPRPAALMPVTAMHDDYDAKRVTPVEVTVWQVNAKVTALKLETDGDYHLVLQDESGAEMVAEIPYPDNEFIASTSPFFADVGTARAAVNEQFGEILAKMNFIPSGIEADPKLIPVGAAGPSAFAAAAPPKKVALVSDSTAAFKDSDLFSARIDPADATLTGVGFFDRAHGQTGAAPNVIELHPLLEITFG